MDSGTLLAQVRVGMVALSSDGKRIGKITQIHTRSETETYLEVTPRGNLWKPWQLIVEVQRLFLPGNSVTEVTGKDVRVEMDAKTAKGCTWRPNWIPREIDDPAKMSGGGGGGG